MKDIKIDGYDEAVEINIFKADHISKLYKYIELKLKNPVVQRLLRIHINCFVEPHMVLAMAKCIIYIKHLGIQNMIQVIPNDKFKNYLSGIGFVEFCRLNYETPKAVPVISTSTSIGLWRINSSNMNEYSIVINRYLGEYYKKSGMIESCICELANNVCDHSESPIDAYIFCQYFPGIKRLIIIIGDMGVGIPSKIRTKDGLSMLSDKDAIAWALIEKNSTNSQPHNRGLGLDTIKSDVIANKGDLSIYSGECHYKLTQGVKEEWRENSIEHFKGTMICIGLNTNNIEEEEVLEYVPDWD